MKGTKPSLIARLLPRDDKFKCSLDSELAHTVLQIALPAYQTPKTPAYQLW